MLTSGYPNEHNHTTGFVNVPGRQSTCRLPARRAMVFVLWSVMVGFVAGCASNPPQQDPFVKVNRKTYSMNEALDGNLFEPVARGYSKIMPDPIERMFPRFFDNLNAGDRFAGALLQGKFKGSGIVLGRFVVNSTIGLAGLFDTAKTLGLQRQNEDIGQALESWGLTGSPYFMIPFFGPTTIVELPDWAMAYFLPRAIMGDLWNPGLQLLQLLSARAAALDTTDMVDKHAVDPYVFVRDSYLQRRRSLLYDGDLPEHDPFLSTGTSECAGDGQPPPQPATNGPARRGCNDNLKSGE